MKHLSLAAFFFLSSPIYAGEVVSADLLCDKTRTITKTLKEKFHEQPILVGKASDVAGSIMTLWINPETKTWSILATKDDLSCIIGVGDKFDVIDPKPTL